MDLGKSPGISLDGLYMIFPRSAIILTLDVKLPAILEHAVGDQGHFRSARKNLAAVIEHWGEREHTRGHVPIWAYLKKKKKKKKKKNYIKNTWTKLEII